MHTFIPGEEKVRAKVICAQCEMKRRKTARATRSQLAFLVLPGHNSKPPSSPAARQSPSVAPPPRSGGRTPAGNHRPSATQTPTRGRHHQAPSHHVCRKRRQHTLELVRNCPRCLGGKTPRALSCEGTERSGSAPYDCREITGPAHPPAARLRWGTSLCSRVGEAYRFTYCPRHRSGKQWRWAGLHAF